MKDKDPKFLYADDLVKDGAYAEFTLTIAEILAPGSVTFANKRKNERIAIRFDKAKKMFMPCSTQHRLLKLMLGREESSWIGKEITLHVASDTNPGCNGEKAPCIRIRATIDKGLIPGAIRKHMGEDLTGRRLVG